MSEIAEGPIDLEPCPHHRTERTVFREAVRGPKGHHLIEVAHPLGGIGILARQPERRHRAVRADRDRPVHRGILDGLAFGIGPKLRLQFVDHFVVAEERRGCMAETVLVTVRVEPPFGQVPLRLRSRDRAELGDVVANRIGAWLK